MKHRHARRRTLGLVSAAFAVPIVLGAMCATLISTASAQTQPSAGAPVATSATPQWASGRVVVEFRAGVDRMAQAALERANNATVVGTVTDLGVTVLRVPAGAEQRVVAALQHSGKAVYAERDGSVSASDVTPNDPYWPQQWGSSLIKAPAAWAVTTGNSNVTLAVLDSGLNGSLSEFAGRVVPGYNFVANNTNTSDDNSHGTAVTGIAAGAGNNGTNTAGMCWSCSIMPVKVLDSSGNGTDSGVASGVTWAVDHGARVLNLSLSGAASSTTMAHAIAYAIGKGVVVIAAAGNNSSSALSYPAAYDGVLSVAGSDQYDRLYSWSEYGSWVKVAAPGNNYSTWPSGNVYLFGGTSSATPVVAGLAALMLSANPALQSADVVNAIESTTDALQAGSVAYGRVNAAAALAAVTGGSIPVASPSPTATSTATPTASPSPTPTTTPTSSATPTASPTPTSTGSPSPTPTTVAYGGSLGGNGSKSWALTSTAGGPVSVTVSSAASPVTVTIKDASGATVGSASGGSGTSISALVPAGSFSLVLTGKAKTKFQINVTYTP